MKWLIASDLHGSAAHCRKLAQAREREGADRIILLGDLLYHGPRNALPEGYDPKEVITLLNGWKDRILCVRGNCDAEVDQMVLDFPIMADYALLTAGECVIFATHGHRYNTGHLPPLENVNILLHGHTHVPACRELDGYVYLNPGSVSLPKEGSRHSYMTFDGERFDWKDLDGTVYHSYTPKF